MQGFLEFANYHNFKISQPNLDGKIYRLDREGKGNAWYIGKTLHTTKGESYVIATLGDWKTGEKLTYKTEKKNFYSREDLATIKSQMAFLKKKSEEETKIKNEEAGKKSESMWASASKTIRHDYMTRKKLDGEFGIRQSGDQLLVPCRYANGKLAGLQRIFPDGAKRFVSGQKTGGTFHVIGNVDDSEIIYLTEGFATAASIHMATGMAVVVAFSCGNLLQIARALKDTRDQTIIICGDDDRFTDGNPGRTAAEKASAILGTIPVFPIFANQEKKLTDFNDLHCEEGLDAVINQLCEADTDAGGFTPLGYTVGEHYFYKKENSSIVRISSAVDTQMFKLAPREYWLGMYDNGKGKIDWESAKDDIIQQSNKAGVFDQSKIRGCGVWQDRGRIVVNTGKYLLIDGKKSAEIESNFVYIDTKNKIEFVQNNIATTDDLRPLVDVLKLLKFKNRADWKLVAGWLAIARIAGALPVRPHLWLTGGSGTGKSTLFENIISPMLGSESGKVSAGGGGSTEAGIRQSVAADAVPVILDEFELTGKRNHDANIEAIIDLMRQSWSTTGSKILKGSPAGVVTEFSLAFAALVSSIRISLDSEADRSRFCIVELENHGSVESEWQAVLKHLSKINEALGERLFARSVACARTILRNYETARMAISAKTNQRTGQQYGMLIAGYHSIVSDTEIDLPGALELFLEIRPQENEEANENVRDEFALLEHILTTRVDVSIPNGDKQDMIKKETIGAMIENEVWAAQLPTYGIMVTAYELRIRNKHAELGKILRDTPWSKNWARTLGRLPGSIARKDCGWSIKKTEKCSTIPLSVLEN
jgi:putative DNA primase/helicase